MLSKYSSNRAIFQPILPSVAFYWGGGGVHARLNEACIVFIHTAQCLWRPEEGVISLGARVKSGCQPADTSPIPAEPLSSPSSFCYNLVTFSFFFLSTFPG